MVEIIFKQSQIQNRNKSGKKLAFQWTGCILFNRLRWICRCDFLYRSDRSSPSIVKIFVCWKQCVAIFLRIHFAVISCQLCIPAMVDTMFVNLPIHTYTHRHRTSTPYQYAWYGFSIWPAKFDVLDVLVQFLVCFIWAGLVTVAEKILLVQIYASLVCLILT